jgi:DNA-binding IclR family transcriptional regulator
METVMEEATQPGKSLSSNVKTALRVIEIMEIYAREGRSLTLTELAKLLDAPVSSCLGLVRTLASLGYLYETGRRQGYYPTGRLLAIAQRIAKADPILERVYPVLEAVRNDTGETAVFGKLQDDGRVVYLAVVESQNAVRYAAMPGELRDPYTNSIGRALLGSLPEPKRDALLAQVTFPQRTPKTLASREALISELNKSAERGWYQNIGESILDLGAVAVPVALSGETYGISVAGPINRIVDRVEALAESLQAARRSLQP